MLTSHSKLNVYSTANYRTNVLFVKRQIGTWQFDRESQQMYTVTKWEGERNILPELKVASLQLNDFYMMRARSHKDRRAFF